MIEFRYDRRKMSDTAAVSVGEKLASILRAAIRGIRPERGEYGVTVEGDPFGPIAHEQPDLRIYIFYHADWEFSSAEKQFLSEEMKAQVRLLLQQADMADLIVKIRFYARAGHFSSSIP